MVEFERGWRGFVLGVEASEAAASARERREAFDRFTQSRLDRAYSLAACLLRDSLEAEDAVHDAALQAWTHWGALRDPSRADAWFDRILVNECRTRMRRRRIGPITLAEPPDTAVRDASSTIADRDRLLRALDVLDAEHRLVVVLRYLADLQPAEIAERTGAREGTVRSRLHYALREMRAAIEAAERLPAVQR